MKTSFLFRITPGVILFTFSFLLYITCIRNGFLHWDDGLYVTGNTRLSPLNLSNLGWILTTTHSGNWHPLTFLSHALDIHFFGMDARYHHLVNVLIHSLNTVLAYLLSYRLICLYLQRSATPQPSYYFPVVAAFISALLFSIHPLRVESVAWIAERKDLLFAFFYMASILAYLKYTKEITKKHYYYALLLFFLSLTSKPMAVTLPAVLLIIDFLFLQRHNTSTTKSILVEKVPFILLSIFIAVITIVAQEDIGAVKSTTQFPLDVRVYNAFNSIIFYLQKTLAPLILLPHYTHPDYVHYLSGRTLINISVVTLTTLAVLLYHRKSSHIIAPVWLYYLVTITPILGFVQAGDQAAADRFTYIPTLPFYIIAGYFLALGLISTRRSRRYTSMALVITLVMLYSYLTHKQIPYWKNDISLWIHCTTWNKEDSVAQSNLGASYIDAGKPRYAIPHLKKALQVKPDYYEASLNLAIAYENTGRFQQALAAYHAMVENDHSNNEIATRIGRIYLKLGEYTKAKRQFEKILLRSPNNRRATFGLVMTESGLGNKKRAIQLAQEYLQKYPDDKKMEALLLELTKAPR